MSKKLTWFAFTIYSIVIIMVAYENLRFIGGISGVLNMFIILFMGLKWVGLNPKGGIVFEKDKHS